MIAQASHKALNRTTEKFNQFQTIDLEEMNKARLMKRIDNKFLLNRNQLEKLLPILCKKYIALSINGIVNHPYTSVYYDTMDLQMYKNHHNHHADRYKIRQRMYHSSGESFLEVKHKTNKGVTEKQRVATKGLFNTIPYAYFPFIKEKSPYAPFGLKRSEENSFTRITLTNSERNQRITIDTNISFWRKNKHIELENLVIVEVKSDKANFDKTIFELFKTQGIHENTMSKYSVGLAMLMPELKQNNFKQKIRTINKIMSA